MRSLFLFTGLLTVCMIFWAVLAWLLGMPSLQVSFPLAIISTLLFLGVGLLKNLAEKRKFEAYLEELKRDRVLQAKLENERLSPGDKTGRAKIKAHYRDRNSGVTWTGASIHGAVPKRNKRRGFLSQNR